MKLRILSVLIGAVLMAGSESFAQVIINEIMFDPEGSEDQYGEYVELYNPGTVDVDIEGWIIYCHGGFVHPIVNGAPLIVPAGGYLLVGRSTDTTLNGNVNVAYAYGDDIPLGGGDAFWLVNGDYPSVDSVDFGQARFANPRGASLELFNHRMNNNVGDSWAVATTQWAGADFGTPGEQNSVYSSIIPTDIVVSEIMTNSAAVGDIFGEWFEVYNTTDTDINLEGVVFKDNAVDQFTVVGSFVVPAHDFAVFTVNDNPATNGGLNHARMYDWGTNENFRFGSNDAVILKSGILTVDSVRFSTASGWADPEGASLVLTNLTVDNNDPDYWIVATLREPAYTGTVGDLGSPGTLGHDQSLVDITPPKILFARSFSHKIVEVHFNEPLDPATVKIPSNYYIDPVIGSSLEARISPTDPTVVKISVGEAIEPYVIYDLSVSGVSDTLGNTILLQETAFAFAPPALPLDIVVSEIMFDPTVVSDAEGEWFEVYNRTDRDIEMSGWTISDNSGQSFTIVGSVMVPAAGFAVFTVNTDSATNGGLVVAQDSCGCPCTMLYDWGTSSNFSLLDQDAIIIRAGDITIDSLVWGGSGWENPSGASLAWKNFPLNWPRQNGANWVAATLREPGYSGTTGDLGSPGTLGSNQFLDGELTFTMTIPAANLIVPAAGDTFDVNLRWNHQTNINVWFDVWCEMLRPDGVTIPLLGPLRLMVPANAILNRRPRVMIPASYPAGTYTIYAGMSTDGMYPADTIRFAQGTFQKVASSLTTGLDDLTNGIPEFTYLNQNYPNPFNPSTEIRYGLRENAWTTLTVFNSLGQEVVTLVNEFQAAGHRAILWNGRNDFGHQVATGVYLYRLTAGQFVETRKFILMK